jgi:hypothetical protein
MSELARSCAVVGVGPAIDASKSNEITRSAAKNLFFLAYWCFLMVLLWF